MLSIVDFIGGGMSFDAEGNTITLRDTLLIFNQVDIYGNSLLIFVCESVRFEPFIDIFVSSTNKTGLVDLQTFGKLFIYNKNNESPSIDPWKTPHCINLVLEGIPLYVTYCFPSQIALKPIKFSYSAIELKWITAIYYTLPCQRARDATITSPLPQNDVAST